MGSPTLWLPTRMIKRYFTNFIIVRSCSLHRERTHSPVKMQWDACRRCLFGNLKPWILGGGRHQLSAKLTKIRSIVCDYTSLFVNTSFIGWKEVRVLIRLKSSDSHPLWKCWDLVHHISWDKCRSPSSMSFHSSLRLNRLYPIGEAKWDKNYEADFSTFVVDALRAVGLAALCRRIVFKVIDSGPGGIP